MRWLLCVILTFQVAFARGEATTPSSTEFPFEYREGLLWIEVHVSQSEKPLNFLLDTGAGVSAINLKTAKRIGLKLGWRVDVRGVDTKMAGYWQQRMSVKVGDVTLPTEYVAVDLEKLSRSCERPVDGLLGADFFRDRVVQIDFVAQRVRLLNPEDLEANGDALPLQLRSCGMRVPISVNGHQRQWVRLDTGCATALQWVTSEVPDQCTHQVAIGLAEVTIPQSKTSVGIGEHQFSDIPTGLHEKAIFPGEAGLLGNGLLSRFATVTIDSSADRVILQERIQAQ